MFPSLPHHNYHPPLGGVCTFLSNQRIFIEMTPAAAKAAGGREAPRDYFGYYRI